MATTQRKKISLPRFDARRSVWVGGDTRTLYTFVAKHTGDVGVFPGGGPNGKLLMSWGPEATVRGIATRAEAEEHWQNPLHGGWKVVETGAQHATKKYGPKTSAKVERTMHEFKRGKLKSGSGKKVTSRAQAIAIGLSQARRKGYKVPPAPSRHATMSLDARVRAHLSHMRPGQEIDARGMARVIGGVDPLEADYALERAEKAGLAVTSDGRWFGPAGSAVAHAAKKSPARLQREIDESLATPAWAKGLDLSESREIAKRLHVSQEELEAKQRRIESDRRAALPSLSITGTGNGIFVRVSSPGPGYGAYRAAVDALKAFQLPIGNAIPPNIFVPVHKAADKTKARTKVEDALRYAGYRV